MSNEETCPLYGDKPWLTESVAADRAATHITVSAPITDPKLVAAYLAREMTYRR